MSAKTTAENQQPLFEHNSHLGAYGRRESYVPWTEYSDAKKVATVTSPEKGAYVDIEERWSALAATLGHLAHTSKMIGLQNAVHTPRREELKERYGDELPDVIANAETAGRQSEVEARNAFRQAYGYGQMVEHTKDPLKVSEDFVDVYDEFQNVYYGSKGNKAREKLKTKIARNQAEAVNRRFTRRAVLRHLSGDSD